MPQDFSIEVCTNFSVTRTETGATQMFKSLMHIMQLCGKHTTLYLDPREQK